LFYVETGEKRKLTNPPAGAIGDTAPAFSPDGRILAFARQLEAFFRSDSYLLHLAGGYRPQGEPERVRLDDPYLYGATWTPDGKEVVFATGKGLWRMAASKPATPRRLPFGPDNAVAPALSRQGNRLAYSVERSDANIWRIDLREPGGKPGAPVRFIASTLVDYCPAYSPDGKRIACVGPVADSCNLGMRRRRIQCHAIDFRWRTNSVWVDVVAGQPKDCLLCKARRQPGRLCH